MIRLDATTAINLPFLVYKIKSKGFTDSAIAEEVGVSQPTITRIRNGQSAARYNTVLMLAKMAKRIGVVDAGSTEAGPAEGILHE